jgi:hypothetical protein
MALESALHTMRLLLRDCEVQALGVVAAVRLCSFLRDSPGDGNPRKLAGAGVARGMSPPSSVARVVMQSPVAPQTVGSVTLTTW